MYQVAASQLLLQNIFVRNIDRPSCKPKHEIEKAENGIVSPPTMVIRQTERTTATWATKRTTMMRPNVPPPSPESPLAPPCPVAGVVWPSHHIAWRVLWDRSAVADSERAMFPLSHGRPSEEKLWVAVVVTQCFVVDNIFTFVSYSPISPSVKKMFRAIFCRNSPRLWLSHVESAWDARLGRCTRYVIPGRITVQKQTLSEKGRRMKPKNNRKFWWGKGDIAFSYPNRTFSAPVALLFLRLGARLDPSEVQIRSSTADAVLHCAQGARAAVPRALQSLAFWRQLWVV